MRHRIKRDTLSRTSPHRRSMMANMSASLLVHEQIKTTVPKAKLLRPFVERLITLSKKESLGSRRLALSRVRDQDAVRKLFATLGARYKNRNGGYCRIIRCGFRPGDNAPMAYIELVDRDTAAKGKEDKARHLEAQSARLDQQTVAS